MNLGNKEVILLIISLFILQIIIIFPKVTEIQPRYAPACGICDEWQNVSCGADRCSPLEMYQVRDCYSDTGGRNDTEPPPKDEPLFSTPLLECITRCVPMPSVCNSPPIINNLYHLNNSINVSLNVSLVWNSTDAENHSILHDIYFNKSQNLTLISSNYSNNLYQLFNLEENITYFWKVIAKDNYSSSTSELWQFTTTILPINNQTNTTNVTITHLECISNTCTLVNGSGTDECSVEGDDCGDDGSTNTTTGDTGDVPPPRLEVPPPTEEQPLFDIKVNLKEDSQTVYRGGKVFSQIILYNFGDIHPVDIYLECAIEDSNDDKLDIFTETLAVETQTSIDRDLRVPEDAAEGRYDYTCYMNYPNGQVISSDAFEVKESEVHERQVEIPLRVQILFVIAFLLMVVAITNIFIKKRHKQKIQWKQRK